MSEAKVVNVKFFHQRRVEPGYAPDSPDGWDDVGYGYEFQAEAVRAVQKSPTRPARIIRRETVETILAIEERA